MHGIDLNSFTSIANSNGVFRFQSHGEVNSVSDLEVVSQLNMIRDKILVKADCQLHNHLMQLDIPLPLFGM